MNNINQKTENLSHDTENNLHSYNDKPAVMGYNKKGKKKYAIWYKNGSVHRVGGKAAVIHIMDTGELFKAWYENDVLLREVYSRNNETLSDLYYYEEDHATMITNPLLGKSEPVVGTWLDKWMSTF